MDTIWTIWTKIIVKINKITEMIIAVKYERKDRSKKFYSKQIEKLANIEYPKVGNIA